MSFKRHKRMQSVTLVDYYEYNGQLLYGTEAFYLLLSDHHIHFSKSSVDHMLREMKFFQPDGMFYFENLFYQNWHVIELSSIRKVKVSEISGIIPFAHVVLTWDNFQFLLVKIRKYIGERMAPNF
jgi:hypothetical protein